MNKQDQNRFKELITSIADIYGKEFTSSEIKAWWAIFKPYNISEFEQGVYSHISCPESGMYSPKPANIIKFIASSRNQLEQSIDDRAELAWLEITSEIRRTGAYGNLEIDDKQALAAVKSLGGWKSLCHKTESELVWVKKEFTSVYRNFDKTPVELLPNKISGLIELSEHKAGRAGIESLQNLLNRVEKDNETH